MKKSVFYSLDRQAVLRNHPDVRWATCLNVFDTCDAECYIPSGLGITPDEQQRVIGVIQEIAFNC
jgi:hypothetical protein